jgi:hypothetical protein
VTAAILTTPSRPAPSEAPMDLAHTAELLLRDPAALDAGIDDPEQVGRLTESLLAISALGTGAHGAAVALAAATAGRLTATEALAVPPALVLAMLGALTICLPSFHLSAMLAGVDASFRRNAAEALRVQATTSVYLVAILPAYAAYALGAALGWIDAAGAILSVGLAAPFALGVLGISALRSALGRRAGRVPGLPLRRGRVLLRLILVWGGLYAAVAPTALWRLLGALGVPL